MASTYSDKVAAKNGVDTNLESLKVEAGRIEERLNAARNQYNTWVQKAENAKADFEKLQKDVADWQRKQFSEMEAKENDLKAREANVVKHELELKDKMIDAQRLKMKSEDAESRYKEALERTETYCAKLKDIGDLVSAKMEELNKTR